MRNKHREGQTLFLTLVDKDRAIYDPFDLVTVTRTQALQQPLYYTVTVTGVTFIRDGDASDVTELPEWLQQKAVFSMIRKYSFFRDFAKRKFFRIWKDQARSNVYLRARTRVSQSLLLLDSSMGPALVQINSLIMVRAGSDMRLACLLGYC